MRHRILGFALLVALDVRAQEGTPSDGSSSAEAGAVVVTIERTSQAASLAGSAEAVQVVETERARRESAELGEVLRRTSGIGLRRTGGLGSETRLSVGGMTDNQIRFFMDGVPLDFMGFGLGLGVVPVNLVEHIEVYRGVVPIRFGSDALGGAVNLATDDDYSRARFGASYQTGSFGVYRGTVLARQRFGAGPFVATASGFADHADNDYPIEVEAPDELGRPRPITVHRFHDRYRAAGANLELGLVELPWARRLLLRAYLTDHHKQIQHNSVMTVPYGEVASAERVGGATLRYEHELSTLGGLHIEGLAGVARRRAQFFDQSQWSYDWSGRRIRQKLEPGEIGTADRTTFDETRLLLRVGLGYRPLSGQYLRLSSTLETSSRGGKNELYESDEFLDPARAEQRLTTLVSGLEHELKALDERLENIAFVKDYFYSSSGDRGDYYNLAPIADGFVRLGSDSHRFGVGDSLRYRLHDALVAKVSYEYATRFPEPDEVFGDGALALANLELEPEVSHNVNVGLSLLDLWLGEQRVRADVLGFLRASDRLIFEVPVRTDFTQSFNVWSSLARGIEGSVGWTSPGDYLALDANVTWADVRNTSSSGPFADFDGDRIPNRPWLYANFSALFRLESVGTPEDELSLTWYGNYVGGFFRSWESAGRPDYKLRIDAQFVQSVALSYVVRSIVSTSLTFDVQNLTDVRAYDFLGVQRPGRAFYVKGTLEY